MLEWKDNYNSFNSWKGLTYINHYKAIDEWRTGKRKAPLPPIEVSLDPIHACNLGCSHCNASRYLADKDNKKRRMDDKHMMNLIKFLARWGVKGICFGGGGEPSMHSKLAEAIELAVKLGLECSVATNGIIISEELMKAYSKCRWVGISVDASQSNTYEVGRRSSKNDFNIVIDNISGLTKYIKKVNGRCEVAYKFLIFDYNQKEIFSACKLAKLLGVKDFHARPADFRHQGMTEKQANFYNIKNIKTV